jgi:hypothetical protein
MIKNSDTLHAAVWSGTILLTFQANVLPPSSGWKSKPMKEPEITTPIKNLLKYIIFYLVCEAIGTAATPGLLYQPRVIVKMIVEKQMDCKLAGETEVLGENLSQHHFCPSQNPT